MLHFSELLRREVRIITASRHLIPCLVLGALGCSSTKTSEHDTGAAVRVEADTGAPVQSDDDTAVSDSGAPPFAGDVDVVPTATDGVLTNPGMGFADFHFGWWCNLPPITFSPEECAARVEANWPENYPDAGTAYFRWTWADLEPEPGEIATDLIDTTIESSNLLGETLGFRVMAILEGGYGVPEWLTLPPYSVAGEWIDGMFWPDVRDPTFQAEHARMLTALGERYNAHPGLDHVDIGTVGCWGEWNTACLSDGGGLFGVYSPATTAEEDEIQAAYEAMIDHHLAAFPDTPVVMLGIGGEPGREVEMLTHATGGGAGWRVDCWGDYGYWGDGWNHMVDYYPAMISTAISADPAFEDVWQHAPVQLEVCGVMSDWEALGWSTEAPDGEVYKSFEWSLDVHASLLNAKFNAIPDAYVAAVDSLLIENGYRFTLDLLNHPGAVNPGDVLTLSSRWSNLGTAPAYLPRALTWRLSTDTSMVELTSAADIREWLPGEHDVVEDFQLPTDVPAGSYRLHVALLDRAGVAPVTVPLPPTMLAIEGREDDGWYPLSEITVE